LRSGQRGWKGGKRGKPFHITNVTGGKADALADQMRIREEKGEKNAEAPNEYPSPSCLEVGGKKKGKGVATSGILWERAACKPSTTPKKKNGGEREGRAGERISAERSSAGEKNGNCRKLKG